MKVLERDNSRVVRITGGNLRNGTFPLGGVLDLFPRDAIGPSSRSEGTGKPITLEVAGLASPIRTDIPSESATGRPRPMFRDRSWAREFYRINGVRVGDAIRITRLESRQFTIVPSKPRKTAPGNLVNLNGHSSAHPPKKAENGQLRFIDLFCGIGGFRIAFEAARCKCVFSCDWDKFARKTYFDNFGETPAGDINKIDIAGIEPFDILCAGFPCQPFSLAGVSKKNSLGRKHGFEDARQGNLFFSIARILDHHKPAAFVLENVKHLVRHDKGRTFSIIYDTLTKDLGYRVEHRIVDARCVVPQHRERIFLVGFKPNRPFEFPKFGHNGPKLDSILQKQVPPKYTLTDHLWSYLQAYAEKHRSAGNGFGFGLFTPDDVARTLSARYHKDGSEILISQGPRKNPRRLTPGECALLMGFPPNMRITVSDTQAYRQFGNSVVVPVVERIAKEVVEALARPPIDSLSPVQTLFDENGRWENLGLKLATNSGNQRSVAIS